MNDILIIGAGASGLSAAYELCKGGYKVTMLEARERLGGRIHTLHDSSFNEPVELGAEFVHGNLPVSIRLLNEAGIDYFPVSGKMIQFSQGRLNNGSSFFAHWDLLEEKLNELNEDITIQQFLDKYFTGENAELKNSIRAFVEGYDAAEPAKASALAFKKEWQEEEPSQYVVKGGYSGLIDFLASESKKYGSQIHLSSAVKEIKWSGGVVEAITETQTFKADKVIITLPPAVLLAGANEEGSIKFTPAIPDRMAALEMLGYGGAMKILLQFKTPFWQDAETTKRIGGDLKDARFIFSDEIVPTWWTQHPVKSGLLTGWLAGPRTEQFKADDNEVILSKGLQSLSSIFQMPEKELREQLTAWHVANWPADPYTRGGYTYATVKTTEARAVLSDPLENTLFFAGEAYYTGPEMGTVEAALSNGVDVAQRIIN